MKRAWSNPEYTRWHQKNEQALKHRRIEGETRKQKTTETENRKQGIDCIEKKCLSKKVLGTIQDVVAECDAGENCITERHNQVADIVHRNTSAVWVSNSSRWEIPQKIVENNKAKVELSPPEGQHVLINQMDIMVRTRNHWWYNGIWEDREILGPQR